MFKSTQAIALLAFVLYFLSFDCFVSCRVVKRDAVDSNTLELVHVLFRHGNRTPDKNAVYKNDPYSNVTYRPIGYGQLTNAGKRKEYNIGKELRSRYYDFLTKNDFTLDTVDARCTDYNRTKMSLQLVLASLFPPRGDLVWENRLDWQPVPFNYWPIHEDHVLADPLANCPKYKKLFWEYLNSTEGKKLFENYTEIIEHIEHHAGQPMNSKEFANLYFTLTTEKENGYNHPEWARDIYHHITQLAINDYEVSTATPELKKYVVGFLVKKIIDDSLAKIKGEYNRDTKIFLYSAHEFNVAILLRFFGVFYPHVPPYGSYVIIEIHNINGFRFVKLFYQDYTSETPKRLYIPNCGNICKLRKFIKLHKHMLPDSEKECFQTENL